MSFLNFPIFLLFILIFPIFACLFPFFSFLSFLHPLCIFRQLGGVETPRPRLCMYVLDPISTPLRRTSPLPTKRQREGNFNRKNTANLHYPFWTPGVPTRCSTVPTYDRLTDKYSKSINLSYHNFPFHPRMATEELGKFSPTQHKPHGIWE